MDKLPNIAQTAIEVGRDYLLPVKGNQPALQEVVISAFEALEKEQMV